jgi:general secretion pathway protein D
MRHPLLVLFGCCALIGPLAAAAQQSASDETSTKSTSEAGNGIPIERLIDVVAKKTGKRFLIDPRVRANVLIAGQAPAEITYSQLLSVLTVYGFIAVDVGNYIEVLPDANARTVATPIITSKDTRLPDEIVTEVIQVKYISAAQLVPILRPMVPQYGHLVAFLPGNGLIIADHFANVRRLEAIIRSMDVPNAQPPPGVTPEH